MTHEQGLQKIKNIHQEDFLVNPRKGGSKLGPPHPPPSKKHNISRKKQDYCLKCRRRGRRKTETIPKYEENVITMLWDNKTNMVMINQECMRKKIPHNISKTKSYRISDTRKVRYVTAIIEKAVEFNEPAFFLLYICAKHSTS